MSFKHAYSENIDSGHVYIWSALAITESQKLKELSTILSPDELIRANKYRFEKDRSVYITARFLLRNLLGGYKNTDPNSIKFDYSEFGKPSYLNNEELDFNVSHSGKQIIIGFSKGQTIGVDIEKIKRDFDVLELAENFFSNEEIKALSLTEETEKHQAFYRCWTRKEAFIKAVGEGLSYPLDSFAVTIDNDNQARFLKIDNSRESEKKWQLHSFVPAQGFISAVAVDGDTKKIEFFDANEILDLTDE